MGQMDNVHALGSYGGLENQATIYSILQLSHLDDCQIMNTKS
jgi:hypothetical protein